MRSESGEMMPLEDDGSPHNCPNKPQYNPRASRTGKPIDSVELVVRKLFLFLEEYKYRTYNGMPMSPYDQAVLQWVLLDFVDEIMEWAKAIGIFPHNIGLRLSGDDKWLTQ